MSKTHVPQASEKVLPTLNQDGSRNFIRPRLSKGRFWWMRKLAAWALMVIFFAIPYVKVKGKPLILLDIPNRRYTIFGTTFLPTDTLLLFFLILGALISIFLITALVGRVWCGWACPQTVYMEFLFRPVERWIEGSPGQQRKLDREGPNLRRMLKWLIFLLLAAFLSHTFLAYFIGIETLFQWIQQSPWKHPTPFLIMLFVTFAIFFDFAWFREQTCLIVCPYGRFQSALLDRHSLIVGYDVQRGESDQGRSTIAARRKLEKQGEEVDGFGDCIDCRACVITCPTGIDIRDGLQMECINCTQCIDACDAIMEKVGKPTGLIRYSSEEMLEESKQTIIRPRVILYFLLASLVAGLFTSVLLDRQDAKVSILRIGKEPYRSLGPKEISNQLSIKLINQGTKTRTYHVRIGGLKGARLIAPYNPLKVKGDEMDTMMAFLIVPKHYFRGGKRPEVTFFVKDGKGFSYKEKYRVVGPLDVADEPDPRPTSRSKAPKAREKTPSARRQAPAVRSKTPTPRPNTPAARAKAPTPRTKAPAPAKGREAPVLRSPSSRLSAQHKAASPTSRPAGPTTRKGVSP